MTHAHRDALGLVTRLDAVHDLVVGIVGHHRSHDIGVERPVAVSPGYVRPTLDDRRPTEWARTLRVDRRRVTISFR